MLHERACGDRALLRFFSAAVVLFVAFNTALVVC